MSQIAYDPVKDRLASLIRKSRLLRTLFYKTLDLFFLRGWHIRKILRKIYRDRDRKKVFNMLDAGSGFGQYDRYILRKFKQAMIRAVDVKEDYLADCREYFQNDIKSGRISFEKQDLLEFVSDEGHDLVLCVDVLEHIEDDVTVMKNLNASLEPGGYLLMHSPSHLAEDDAGGDEFFVDEHARAGYSAEELTEKLKSAGFETVEITYTYGSFGHAAWVMMIKWPMLMINKLGFWSVALLPFWYIPVLIPSLLLMRTDLAVKNKVGTGIMALARK